jgi:tape measure domain-containing protein
VAYRADIEIAVRGARQLKDLQNQLLTTADTVSALDGNLRAVANQLPRSISNLKSLASQAAESFDKVALNTSEAIDAAKHYIKTTDELNKGLQERLNLVRSIRATETAAQRRVTPGDAGYGQQTPALPPSMVRLVEIKQNWNKFFRDAAETARDIQQETAADRLNAKKSWAKFFDSAATLAEDLTAQIRATEAAASAAARKRLAATTNKVVDPRGKQAAEFPFGPNPLSTRRFGERPGAVSNEAIDAAMLRVQMDADIKHIQGMRQRRQEFYAWEAKQPRTIYTAYDRNFFAPAISRFNDLARAAETTGAQITKSIGKRLGGATIGGAFPLLFGQGPEAAIGGALGGLLIPGGGGFAGSLLGTLIGDLKSAEVEVTKLASSFGYNEVQARTLAKSFELAGKDADSLKTAFVNIQGLGITSEEQTSLLRIANELSTEYGGKVDRITQSLADTLEQGKVTISSITNLTSQGIPVQEKLADKLGVTREELFKLARDGKVPVQELLDVMVELGIEAENTSDKGKTGFDRFSQAAKDLGIAVANLAETIVTVLAPAIETILNLATRALTAVNGLLTSNVTRQMGQAGLALTFGLESQGIDNIASALNDLNKITPTTVDQTTSLLGNLDDMSRNLQRVRADGANWIRATALQGEVMKAQNRILEERKKLGGPTPEQPIGRIQAPVQLPAKEGRPAKDDTLKNLEAALALTTELQRQEELLLAASDYERTRLQLKYDHQDTLGRINDLEDQSQRELQRSLADRIYALDLAKAEAAEEAKKVEFAKQFNKELTSGIDKRLQSLDYYNVEIAKLSELTEVGDLVKYSAESIGDAFRNTFNDIATGTESAIQAIANFFEQIGKALIDYAAIAIANYIAIGIARIFAGLGSTSVGGDYFSGADTSAFSGGFGVDSSGLTGPSSPLGTTLDYSGVKLADGDYITSPTNAVVGEGGSNEYVIPANKMDSAMSRWNAGARGDSVVTGADPTGGMGGTAVAEAPSQINISGGVFQYNDTSYIRQDQIPSIVSQASKQGEARALRRLQMSPSTRRKVGI